MDLLKGKGVETLGDSSSYVQVDEEGAEREIDRTRRLSVQVNDPILDHDNDKNKKKRKKKKKKQKEKEAEVGSSRLGNETHYNHNSNQDGRGSGGDENTSLTTGARLLRLKNAIQENLISFFEENWWLFLFGAVLSVLLLFCGIFVWNDLSWEAWLTVRLISPPVVASFNHIHKYTESLLATHPLNSDCSGDGDGVGVGEGRFGALCGLILWGGSVVGV